MKTSFAQSLNVRQRQRLAWVIGQAAKLDPANMDIDIGALSEMVEMAMARQEDDRMENLEFATVFVEAVFETLSPATPPQATYYESCIEELEVD